MALEKGVQRINRREHETNEEVFTGAEERRRSMKSFTKKRRIKLIGHTLRRNSLLNRVMEGMLIGGKNVVGRPPLDRLQQVMRDVNVPNNGLTKKKSENREEFGASQQTSLMAAY